MLSLRPLTILVLGVFPASVAGALGVTLTSSRYEKKLQRVTEERQVYMTLATSAMKMSDESFSFTLAHQETLSTCMERLYAPPTMAPVVITKGARRGGIGGPNTMRGNSRLP